MRNAGRRLMLEPDGRDLPDRLGRGKAGGAAGCQRSRRRALRAGDAAARTVIVLGSGSRAHAGVMRGVVRRMFGGSRRLVVVRTGTNACSARVHREHEGQRQEGGAKAFEPAESRHKSRETYGLQDYTATTFGLPSVITGDIV